MDHLVIDKPLVVLSGADDGGECSLGTAYRSSAITILTRRARTRVITFPARISTARPYLNGHLRVNVMLLLPPVSGAGILGICFWRPFIGDTLPDPLATAATISASAWVMN